jgi:hypothetical protein
MATFYVDPAATGANDGTSWGDAWTTLQAAFDGASTAGDIVYCRGTETIATRIDVDTNSGTDVAPIKFIGCNSSGNNDGTRYVIDANDNNTNGIYCNARHNYWLENFEIKNIGAGGGAAIVGANNSDEWTLINVYIHDCAQHGIGVASKLRFWTTFRLRITNCTDYGIQEPISWRMNHVQIDNCGYGIYNNQTFQPENIIISNCTTMGIYSSGQLVSMRNITIDDCPTGITIAASNTPPWVEGCRITGCSTAGMAIATGVAVNIVGCYFGGNTADFALTGTGTYHILPINGVTTHTTLNGSDTGDGYTDADSNDYTLTANATGRSIEIPVA